MSAVESIEDAAYNRPADDTGTEGMTREHYRRTRAPDPPPSEPDRRCVGCGKPIESTRANRRWCTSACRYRADGGAPPLVPLVLGLARDVDLDAGRVAKEAGIAGRDHLLALHLATEHLRGLLDARPGDLEVIVALGILSAAQGHITERARLQIENQRRHDPVDAEARAAAMVRKQRAERDVER